MRRQGKGIPAKGAAWEKTQGGNGTTGLTFLNLFSSALCSLGIFRMTEASLKEPHWALQFRGKSPGRFWQPVMELSL